MSLFTKQDNIVKPVKYPFISQQINFKQLNFSKGNWASVPGCMPTYSSMQGKSRVFVVDFKRGNTTDNMAIIGQNKIDSSGTYPTGWFCNCTNNAIAMNISNDGNTPMHEILIQANDMSINQGGGSKAFVAFNNDWIRLKCSFYQNGDYLTYKMQFKQGLYVWEKSAVTLCPDRTGIYDVNCRKYQMFLGTVKYSNSFDNLRFTGQLRRFLVGWGDPCFNIDCNDRPTEIEHLYDFKLRAGKMENGSRDANWDMVLCDLVGNNDGIFKSTNDNPAENYRDNPNYDVHPLEVVSNKGGVYATWGGLKRWVMAYSGGLTNGSVNGLVPKTGYSGYIFNVTVPPIEQYAGYTYDLDKGQRIGYSGAGGGGVYIQNLGFSGDLCNPAYELSTGKYGAIFGISFSKDTQTNPFEYVWSINYHTGGWGEYALFYINGTTGYIKWRDVQQALPTDIFEFKAGENYCMTVSLQANSANELTAIICVNGKISKHILKTNVGMWVGFNNKTNFEFDIGHDIAYGNKLHGYVNKFFFVSMKYLYQNSRSEFPDSEAKIRRMLLGLCNNGIDGGYF